VSFQPLHNVNLLAHNAIEEPLLLWVHSIIGMVRIERNPDHWRALGNIFIRNPYCAILYCPSCLS
jgi:hypothetical protein